MEKWKLGGSSARVKGVHVQRENRTRIYRQEMAVSGIRQVPAAQRHDFRCVDSVKQKGILFRSSNVYEIDILLQRTPLYATIIFEKS